MQDRPLAEMGGYTAQSNIIKIHPNLPLIARSLDFDIEVRDLTGKQEPYLLKFPFHATSWKIMDLQMSHTILYAAVTVHKRGT